jgi:hypothetical protein
MVDAGRSFRSHLVGGNLTRRGYLVDSVSDLQGGASESVGLSTGYTWVGIVRCQTAAFLPLILNKQS